MAALVVQSNVKDQLEGTNVATDFYDALDQEVDALAENAARRAQENDRKTVQSRDLWSGVADEGGDRSEVRHAAVRLHIHSCSPSLKSLDCSTDPDLTPAWVE